MTLNVNNVNNNNSSNSNSNHLPTQFQKFIHTSKYARWMPEEGRRESWPETVGRYVDNVIYNEIGGKPENADIILALEDAILNCEIMPSMRCMMTAGKALDRSNVAGFNCSYTPVDHPQVFSEILFILMNGTGVGFSCEKKYVDELPKITGCFHDYCDDEAWPIRVEDSKEGWARAYQILVDHLFAGAIPCWDLSAIRPAGAPLKTFGGRASGPDPLEQLFQHTVDTFQGAEGRKLTPIEVHSIVCMIGSVVVVGGVRRSALISLSDLGDEEMRDAKSGEWWKDRQHFALANNSVAYENTPSAVTFMEEWLSLAKSGSGERGIFNRQAAQRHASRIGRDSCNEFGTNPCAEIVLRGWKIASTMEEAEAASYLHRRHIGLGEGIPNTGGQFCNLSEVVVRSTDSPADLERKIKLAAILGTIQATLTSFPYLRPIWKENTEKEALLGVSLTGIMDNEYTNGRRGNLATLLKHLRQVAVDTNELWAAKLGINKAAAVTCVKPSGTVSSLVDSASGIHARHSEYYTRTARGDNLDPVTQFLKYEARVPHEPCVYNGSTTTVFSFPQRAPAGAVTRNDMTAIEQLEMWLDYMQSFCCHKPSITVSVRDHEWVTVGAFVYRHFDQMSGVSFLPHSDHTYEQAPYQECSREQYAELLSKMPTGVDWSKLKDFERGHDNTTASQEMACVGGVCDIVDIQSSATNTNTNANNNNAA